MPHYIYTQDVTPVRHPSAKRTASEAGGMCNASLFSSSSTNEPAPSLTTGIPLSFLTPSVPSSSSPSKSPSSMRVSKEEIPSVEHLHPLQLHVVIVPHTSGVLLAEKTPKDEQSPKHPDERYRGRPVKGTHGEHRCVEEVPSSPPVEMLHSTWQVKRHPHPSQEEQDKALPRVDTRKNASAVPHDDDAIPVLSSLFTTVATQEANEDVQKGGTRGMAEDALPQTRTGAPRAAPLRSARTVPPALPPSAPTPSAWEEGKRNPHALPPPPPLHAKEERKGTEKKKKRNTTVPPPPPSHDGCDVLPSSVETAVTRTPARPPTATSASPPSPPPLPPVISASGAPPPLLAVDASARSSSPDPKPPSSYPIEDPLQPDRVARGARDRRGPPCPSHALPSPPGGVPGVSPPPPHVPHPHPPLLEEYLREEVERQQHHRRVREREAKKRLELRETYRSKKKEKKRKKDGNLHDEYPSALPPMGRGTPEAPTETVDRHARKEISPHPTPPAHCREAIERRNDRHAAEDALPLLLSSSMGSSASSPVQEDPWEEEDHPPRKETLPLSHRNGKHKRKESGAVHPSDRDTKKKREGTRVQHGKGEEGVANAARHTSKEWEGEDAPSFPIAAPDHPAPPIPPLSSPSSGRVPLPASDSSAVSSKERHTGTALHPFPPSPSARPASHAGGRGEGATAAPAGTTPLTSRYTPHHPAGEKALHVLPFSPVFLRRHVQAAVGGGGGGAEGYKSQEITGNEKRKKEGRKEKLQ